MRAMGIRKRKQFVVEVAAGETELFEVSKESADAVPSFVLQRRRLRRVGGPTNNP